MAKRGSGRALLAESEEYQGLRRARRSLGWALALLVGMSFVMIAVAGSESGAGLARDGGPIAWLFLLLGGMALAEAWLFVQTWSLEDRRHVASGRQALERRASYRTEVLRLVASCAIYLLWIVSYYSYMGVVGTYEDATTQDIVVTAVAAVVIAVCIELVARFAGRTFVTTSGTVRRQSPGLALLLCVAILLAAAVVSTVFVLSGAHQVSLDSGEEMRAILGAAGLLLGLVWFLTGIAGRRRYPLMETCSAPKYLVVLGLGSLVLAVRIMVAAGL